MAQVEGMMWLAMAVYGMADAARHDGRDEEAMQRAVALALDALRRSTELLDTKKEDE